MTTTACQGVVADYLTSQDRKRRMPLWLTKARKSVRTCLNQCPSSESDQNISAQDPEPVQLYSLLTFYLSVHVPVPDTSPFSGRCSCCGQCWPCVSVRLAYRLREGF